MRAAAWVRTTSPHGGCGAPLDSLSWDPGPGRRPRRGRRRAARPGGGAPRRKPAGGAGRRGAVEEIVKNGTQVLARFAEACGGLVIGYAVIRAMIAFVVDVFRGPPAEVPKEEIRLGLGRSLALGLEFLL